MGKRAFWLVAVAIIIVVATLSLAACGSNPASTTAGPTTTAAGAVDAAALYVQYCANCHDKLPDGTVDQITSIVQSGRDTMPGFIEKLTADQITALANWVANGGK